VRALWRLARRLVFEHLHELQLLGFRSVRIVSELHSSTQEAQAPTADEAPQRMEKSTTGQQLRKLRRASLLLSYSLDKRPHDTASVSLGSLSAVGHARQTFQSVRQSSWRREMAPLAHGIRMSRSSTDRTPPGESAGAENWVGALDRSVPDSNEASVVPLQPNQTAENPELTDADAGLGGGSAILRKLQQLCAAVDTLSRHQHELAKNQYELAQRQELHRHETIQLMSKVDRMHQTHMQINGPGEGGF
jgi:hypothetical protein